MLKVFSLDCSKLKLLNNLNETSFCSFCKRGRLRSSGWLGEGSSIPELDDLQSESDPTLPRTEDVIRKTEQITKNIQELLRAAQDNKQDRSDPRGGKYFSLFSLGSYLAFSLPAVSNPSSSLFCYN